MMILQWEGTSVKITKEEVAHVAQLSRLALTEQELIAMQEELGDILADMRMLETMRLEDMPEFQTEKDLCNITREDSVQPSFGRKRLLAAAAVRNDESIVVPKTVE